MHGNSGIIVTVLYIASSHFGCEKLVCKMGKDFAQISQVKEANYIYTHIENVAANVRI